MQTLTRDTDCGPVRGLVLPSGVASFRSIPYAKPPVDELRWQPPVPLKKGNGCWKGTLNATAYKPACLQRANYGKASASSEDCLNLHVSFPLKASSKPRPVFVWLHGGGLLEGSAFSIQSGFDAVGTHLPPYLDAVVIGVEYRLGVAGWLALDALAARDHRGKGFVGNYGLLDTLEALRWVQRNAAHFGGDASHVTVCGQSSGGSLVFALLASPASHSLLHRAISLSGSPRLNSTIQEASSYWHMQVVQRTRCRGVTGGALPTCLLSLNGTELIDAQPPNWHPDCFGLKVFAKDYQYAPILLIDGKGGVLPSPYVDEKGQSPPHLDASIPLIVGTTAEEGDFAPTDDVRGLNQAQFASFIRGRLEPTLGSRFVTRLLQVYLHGPPQPPFDAQRVYSEMVADATVVCPNFYLSQSWQAARQQNNTTAGVYAYRASQPLSHPFCVLRDAHFHPPYCPSYAFHASDMFAWLRPQRSAAFNFSFTAKDDQYGQLINKHFASMVHDGTPLASWSPVSTATEAVHDGLPSDWIASELRLPDAPAVKGDKAEACEMWLGGGWYERIGLVN